MTIIHASKESAMNQDFLPEVLIAPPNSISLAKRMLRCRLPQAMNVIPLVTEEGALWLIALDAWEHWQECRFVDILLV
jgi:hypothetical protein